MNAQRPLSYCLAGLILASVALAQTDPAAATSTEAATSPATTAPTPPASGTVSTNISSALTASLPTYNPAAEKAKKEAAAAEAAEDAAVLTEEGAARPRNQIVRLPRYIVESSKPQVFTEKDVATKKGAGNLAVKKYLSEFDSGVLNKFTLPLLGMSAEDRALMMAAEEERLGNIKSTDETISLLKETDPSEAASLQEDAYDTFMRPSSFTNSLNND